MTLGMMVHTDGSARAVAPGQPASRGYAGFGLHGYLYEDVEPTTGTGNPDYVLTAEDYLSKAEKALAPNIKLVTPVKYLDAWGSFASIQTNNYGELLGAIQALRIALEHNVMVVKIMSDSHYVGKGSEWARNWRANNWLKRDGQLAANIEEWNTFLTLHDELSAKGVTISIGWVKGHNGNFGNEKADVLAYIGMRHSANNIEKTEVIVSEPKGYWKYETNRHPFISHRRMYFNSDPKYLRVGEYYLGEHDKEDDMAGKRMAHGAYALVRLNQPDMALENVRNHVCSLAQGRNSIMLTRLDYLYRSDIHKQVTTYGGIAFIQKRADLVMLEGHDEEPLLKELYTPLIAQRAVDAVQALGMIMDDFIKKESYLVTTDLTSIIYETKVEVKKDVEKRTTVLKPEFKVGYSEMPVDVAFTRPDGSADTVNIRLTLGVDLLDRNALRRLEGDNPKITLVTWSEEPQAFRYATIVETKDGVAINCGFYSNLKIILPKKQTA